MDKIDEYGHKLNIGDVVLFNNQDGKANFINHQFGVIVKMTEYFVVIKPDHPENMWCWYSWNNPVNYVVYRTPERVLLMNDHKYMNLIKE